MALQLFGLVVAVLPCGWVSREDPPLPNTYTWNTHAWMQGGGMMGAIAVLKSEKMREGISVP